MAKYAVIRIGGRQHKVAEGEELLVDKLVDKKAVSEVLLVVDGEKVQVGKPTLTSKVLLKILAEEEKGKKVDILKYKSKSRYRRHMGFRPVYTRILVEKIS